MRKYLFLVRITDEYDGRIMTDRTVENFKTKFDFCLKQGDVNK